MLPVPLFEERMIIMKKGYISFISVLLSAIILLAASITSFSAEVLYTDGDYTYADVDQDYVYLYGYSGASSILGVPNNYNGREVSGISNFAFYQNDKIDKIDFSATASRFDYIGMKSFAQSALSGKLVLPSSIRTLGYGAFEDCNDLTDVEFYSLLKTIPEQCFYSCDSLETVILPINVETIDNRAFADCPNLGDIYFTKSVRNISPSAFLDSYYVVFHVYKNSYAHQYAEDNKIPYVLIDGPKTGDADGDGVVNINDVTAIQRHVAEFEALEDLQAKAADVNGDGSITIEDATILQQYLAEYELSYPINQSIRADYSQCQDGI